MLVDQEKIDAGTGKIALILEGRRQNKTETNPDDCVQKLYNRIQVQTLKLGKSIGS